MSEALTKAQAEELRILRAIVEETLREYLDRDQTDFSHDIARELYEAGMFKATPFKPVAGRADYLDSKITSRGRDRLDELEQLSVPDQAAQPADAKPPKGRKPRYEWHKNPYLIVSLMVVGGVLVMFVVYLIRNHLGIPL